MDKKRAAEKAVRVQKDEAIANKLLMAITLAVLSVIGLMIFYRLLTRADTLLATHAAVGYLAVIFAVTGLAGVMGSVYAYRKKGAQKRLARRLGGTSALLIIAAACFTLMWIFGREVISVLYVLLPGMAALYLVFYLYQREFFCITLLTCAGGMAVWVLSRLLSESAIEYIALPFGVIALVGTAKAFIILYFMKKKGGVIPFSKGVKAFSHGANYMLMFLTCGLVALAIGGSLVFGAVFAYYALFVLFGFLFVMAVYYTVKLM